MPEMQLTQIRCLILGIRLFNYSDNNPIGIIGAKILAKANLPVLQNIKARIWQINIESCYLGNEGIIHLAKSHWLML